MYLEKKKKREKKDPHVPLSLWKMYLKKKREKKDPHVPLFIWKIFIFRSEVTR